MPKISIIIPNYNHANFLKQRLDSVFNQTFQDFEVILLDDASTDDSQVFLKSFQDHPKVSHVAFNTKNTGSPFVQWQKGIDLARGEFIWIAESDDYSDTRFLENCLERLVDNVGMCYAQSVDVDAKNQIIDSRLKYSENFNPNIWNEDFSMDGMRFISEYLLVKNVIPNASAVLFRKSLIDSNTFGDDLKKMHMCGDWFFWLKVLKNTKISFISEELNFFRQHELTTRIHKTLQTKKKRQLEESQIRQFALKNLNLYHLKATLILYSKWYELHYKFSIFSSDFYNICLDNYSKFKFAFNFVNYKLQGKRK